MNIAQSHTPPIKSSKYYKGGGVFFDRVISLDMDEEMSQGDFISLFSDLTISEIFGEDIFTEDFQKNLDLIKERYKGLSGKLEGKNNSWYGPAKEKLDKLFQLIEGNKDESTLRKKIRALLIKQDGTPSLRSPYESIRRPLMGSLYDLIPDFLAYSENVGDNYISKSYLQYVPALEEIMNKLYELLELFSIGSIHGFRNCEFMGNQIQKLIRKVEQEQIESGIVCQELDTLHANLLMKNFYEDPSHPGIQESTLMTQPNIIRLGHTALDITEAISQKVSILLTGEQDLSFFYGLTSQDPIKVQISSTDESRKSVNIHKTSENITLYLEDILLQHSKITNSPFLRCHNVGGSLDSFNIGKMEIAKSNGSFTNRGIPSLTISGDQNGSYRNIDIGSLQIHGKRPNIDNSQVGELCVNGEKLGWLKRKIY